MDTMSDFLQINNKENPTPKQKRYKKSQLNTMTTVQLKEICIREKIMNGIINPLSRQELISTILRFRGEEENLFISDLEDDGFEHLETTLKKKLGTRLKSEGTIGNPAKIILYHNLDLTQFDEYRITLMQKPEQWNEKYGIENPFAISDSDIEKLTKIKHDFLAGNNKESKKAHSIKDIINTNVLLVGDNHKLISILNLTGDGKTPESYYLTRSGQQRIAEVDCRNYYLLFFPKEVSDYLYEAYYKKVDEPIILDYYKVPLADLEVREAEKTSAVLAIDFGTTNTTAAAYLSHGYIPNTDCNDLLNGRIILDDINVVNFLDETKEESTWNPLIPTLASVSDCSNKENIIFHFGYKAMVDTKIKFFDESFSIFYEMKRWVETFDEDQEIMDKRGNIAVVKRKEIIRKYLLYVIAVAEQRFKCRFTKLHLTSPVKLKEQFNHMFLELLPEYEIDIIHMLDEGTAVLYNTIRNLMDKKNYYEGEELSALIMDCGGGTTDLSSCNFTIRNDRASYRVDIETTYENGDTNFGGNNITYRIMQYIKVVFADYYSLNKGIRLENFLNEAEMDIFRMVDKSGREKVYEKLEAAYELAEDRIPTKFRYYENQSREEYYLVKNNFYFLFQIAEQLKLKFYEGRGVLRSRFAADGRLDKEDLRITPIEHWNILVREKGALKARHDFPEIIFNIREIELLIKGDIYWITDRFLNEFFQSRKLEDYSIIKLTGQSCRIDLFREVLKEFLPGKYIDFKPFGKDEAGLLDLKLACVRGAARYIIDRTTGLSEIHLYNNQPKIPYSISGYTHEKEEKMLIYQLNQEKNYGTLSRNKELTELELFLRDGDGKLKFHYIYQNNSGDFEPKTYEEIRSRYNDYKEYLIQDETDNISNTEVKFFIFAAKEQWGFYLVPITREGTQLYLGKETFYPFENNMWEVNFFDGMK